MPGAEARPRQVGRQEPAAPRAVPSRSPDTHEASAVTGTRGVNVHRPARAVATGPSQAEARAPASRDPQARAAARGGGAGHGGPEAEAAVRPAAAPGPTARPVAVPLPAADRAQAEAVPASNAAELVSFLLNF
jgi:hypothetical protein